MTAPLRSDPLVGAVLARFPGAEITDARPKPREGVPPELMPLVGAVPGAPKMISLALMVQVARNEACRIRDTQERLVASGDRSEPHAGELARAEAFDALARLVERVKADPVIVDRLRHGGMNAVQAT